MCRIQLVSWVATACLTRRTIYNRTLGGNHNLQNMDMMFNYSVSWRFILHSRIHYTTHFTRRQKSHVCVLAEKVKSAFGQIPHEARAGTLVSVAVQPAPVEMNWLHVLRNSLAQQALHFPAITSKQGHTVCRTACNRSRAPTYTVTFKIFSHYSCKEAHICVMSQIII